MADQKINELPVKSTPTTGDKMLMIGASEEYQIDYDQLATAILNKLTSKTFTLDQGTKTLVAALNELNSKTGKLVSSKQSFIDIIGKYKYTLINVYIEPEALSEITNSRYSYSAKGVAVYDGANIDFLFMLAAGNTIICGRIDKAGSISSLYHYNGIYDL